MCVTTTICTHLYRTQPTDIYKSKTESTPLMLSQLENVAIKTKYPALFFTSNVLFLHSTLSDFSICVENFFEIDEVEWEECFLSFDCFGPSGWWHSQSE